jgi:hypothetical protein
MKKIVFLFAMVFAVGMAMAQNEAYIEQIGASGSSINVSQTGDLNKIEGPGTVIDAMGASKAAVLQVGGGNLWTSGGVIPDANPNTFDFVQDGMRNYGWVDQEGDIYHAVLDWTQDGDDNSMMLDQYSKFNSLVSTGQQLGNDNKFGGLAGATGTSASIAITDIDETIPAYQHDTHGSAHISFLQDGNRNEVGLFQDNYCCESRFKLLQDGDDNLAALFQYNPSGPGSPGKNLLNVSQTGNSYTVVCFQSNPVGNGNNFASVQ